MHSTGGTAADSIPDAQRRRSVASDSDSSCNDDDGLVNAYLNEDHQTRETDFEHQREDSQDPIDDSAAFGAKRPREKQQQQKQQRQKQQQQGIVDETQLQQHHCIVDETQEQQQFIVEGTQLSVSTQQLLSSSVVHEDLASILGKIKYLPRPRPPTPPPIVSPPPGTTWQSPSPPRVRSTHLLYVP